MNEGGAYTPSGFNRPTAKKPESVLPVFKEGDNVTTFLTTFEALAHHFHWTEEEEYVQLRLSVVGTAADLICAQSPSTLAELKSLLVTSYGLIDNPRCVRMALATAEA